MLRHYVYYVISDKYSFTNEYQKECEAGRLIEKLRDYLDDPLRYDYFDEDYLESRKTYPEIKELINSDDSLLAEEKITKIFIETDDWNTELENTEDVYLGYGDLDIKYNLLKRYFLAFKIALSEIDPHSSLKEEENQKVLDQYLKWLDDIYKEIKLKIPPQSYQEKRNQT